MLDEALGIVLDVASGLASGLMLSVESGYRSSIIF